jgi:hypothetical protein
VNVPVIAVDGDSDFYIRVKFKDSSGTTLDTITRSFVVDGEHELSARFAVPITAIDAQVIYAAKDGANGSTTVVVGWIPGVPTTPTHKVNTTWGPPEEGVRGVQRKL